MICNYDKKALKYNYHVELVEPNTPWKYKPNILSMKNLHGVSMAKIKKCLEDFDQNINVQALLEECRREGVSSTVTLNPAKPVANQARVKPSGLLGNFADKVDWHIPESDQDMSKPAEGVKSAPVQSQKNILSFKPQAIPTTASAPQLYHPETELKTEIDHSVEMLESMFPHVKKEILVDLLLKYHNDISLVTDVILNSVILDDVVDDDKKISETVEEKPATVVNTNPVHQAKSLQQLCTETLNRLDSQLADIETVHSLDKTSSSESPTYNNSNITNKKNASKFHKNQSANDLIEQRTKFSTVRKNHSENEMKTIKRTLSCESDNRQSITPPADTSQELDEEPLFNLKVDTHFIRSLIRIFGDESEENYLQGTFHLNPNLLLTF